MGFFWIAYEIWGLQRPHTGYVGMMRVIEIPRAFLLMPSMQLLCAPWHRYRRWKMSAGS